MLNMIASASRVVHTDATEHILRVCSNGRVGCLQLSCATANPCAAAWLCCPTNSVAPCLHVKNSWEQQHGSISSIPSMRDKWRLLEVPEMLQVARITSTTGGKLLWRCCGSAAGPAAPRQTSSDLCVGPAPEVSATVVDATRGAAAVAHRQPFPTCGQRGTSVGRPAVVQIDCKTS